MIRLNFISPCLLPRCDAQNITRYLADSHKVSSLIFAENAEVSQDEIKFPDCNDRQPMVFAKACQVTAGSPNSNKRMSLWNIDLKPAPVGKMCYARLRFRAYQPVHFLSKLGTLSGSYGLDVRAYELREALSEDQDGWKHEKVVSAVEAYLFVILSGEYRIETIAPEVRYMRSLEPGAWDQYLKREVGRTFRPGLVLYWKHGTALSDEKPMRVFLRFRSSWVRQIIPWFLIGLAALSVHGLLLSDEGVTMVIDWVKEQRKLLLLALGSVTILTLPGLLLRYLAEGAKSREILVKITSSVDRWRFRERN